MKRLKKTAAKNCWGGAAAGLELIKTCHSPLVKKKILVWGHSIDSVEWSLQISLDGGEFKNVPAADFSPNGDSQYERSTYLR
ncbi:MAG: hypothetical protein ACJAVK_002772 [Akkermansiaceae bacterium]|jgi:hypothetical protein